MDATRFFVQLGKLRLYVSQMSLIPCKQSDTPKVEFLFLLENYITFHLPATLGFEVSNRYAKVCGIVLKSVIVQYITPLSSKAVHSVSPEMVTGSVHLLGPSCKKTASVRSTKYIERVRTVRIRFAYALDSVRDTRVLRC